MLILLSITGYGPLGPPTNLFSPSLSFQFVREYERGGGGGGGGGYIGDLQIELFDRTLMRCLNNCLNNCTKSE